MSTYGYIENGILYTKEFDECEVPTGYKPVETFDHEQTQAEDGYVIEVIPYDAGDKIASLKEELSDGDYRVIKCYEASLANKPLPYDINDMYIERQKIRDRINELELTLSNA